MNAYELLTAVSCVLPGEPVDERKIHDPPHHIVRM